MCVGWYCCCFFCSVYVDGFYEWCNWGDLLLVFYYVDFFYVVFSICGNEFDFCFVCYYFESCVGRWL